MNMAHISAGRDRSMALSRDGPAYGWGGIKLLGATLPPGYPGELCTNNATEIGHNRYVQPIPQSLNPWLAFTGISDGYVDSQAIARTGQRVVVPPRGFPHPGRAAYGGGGPARIAPAGCTNGIRRLCPALALDHSGRVWAWGANAAGQLGNGGLQESTQPQVLSLPSRIMHIGAGDTHSFAVDDKAAWTRAGKRPRETKGMSLCPRNAGQGKIIAPNVLRSCACQPAGQRAAATPRRS